MIGHSAVSMSPVTGEKALGRRTPVVRLSLYQIAPQQQTDNPRACAIHGGMAQAVETPVPASSRKPLHFLSPQ